MTHPLLRPLVRGLLPAVLLCTSVFAGPGDGGPPPPPPPAPEALQQTMITRGVPNDGFGTSVAGLGDINNDRYDDFAIGSVPLDSSGTGWAAVYFGGFSWNTTPDIILAGAQPGDRYGRLVAAGDVNGDGHPDIAVAAPGADVPAQNAGRVYVYFGGPGMDSTADRILTGAGAGAALGSFLAAGGDINGDGFDDILTGTLTQVQVFFGGSSMDTHPDLRIPITPTTAQFRSVAGGGDFDGDGFDDIAIGDPGEGQYRDGSAIVLFGGTAPDSLPDWKITGGYAFDYLGEVVAFPGDLNGDTYGDLAVSASGAGKAYVVYGAPHPDSTADVGVDIFAYSALAGAGDVDGDGYSDLLVSHATGNPYLESVYMLFGGPSMDGVVDMALHPDEQAPPVGPNLTSLNFGASLAAAGDLNTDGVGDFLIGAPSDDPAFLARVYVYTNTVTGTDRADRRLPGTGVDRAGTAVALADMNGDGAADILVGAWGEDGGATGRGRAYLYRGREAPSSRPGGGSLGWLQWNEPTATLQGNVGERFGLAVTRAGDLNGDGYEDVAVGAPFNAVNGQDAGTVYIYFGSAVFDTTADLVLRGATWDLFGISLSAAGDVNNDGYDDLIVGAPGNTFSGPPNNNGRALLFLGGPSMDATPDLILNGSMPGDAMGRSVAGAGDLNGDGFGDIVVGAPSNDAMGTDAGMILVYLGSSPVNSIPDLLVLGTAAEDLLGDAVAGAGDMNGDGFDDLLVGAPGSDLGAVNGGAAFVYHGGSPLTGGADQTLSSIYGDASFGSALAGAGDVNLDGYADVVVGARQTGVPTPSSGAAQVFFGGSVPDNVPSVFMAGTTSGERFGTAVAAGDINRDGRSDVVVGAPQALLNGSAAGATYVYFSSSPPLAPRILEAGDNPTDRGGFVRLRWIRSGYDTYVSGRVTRYAIERTTLAGGAPWVEVSSITATDSVFYTAAAPTPADSVPFRFRITAVGSSPAEFWRSAEDTALSLPNPQFNVTFRVNMKQPMRVRELFPPAGHVVTVRGEFNGWLTSSNPDTLRDPDGDSIYVKSVRIPGGRSYQYNHWLNGQNGERFEFSETRILALAMADTILPVVFFEDDPPPTPVLFRVNMSVKMREGTFRPDFGDVVRVRGNFEDWDTSPPLSDPDADSVYTGTLGIRGPLTIQYKFFKTLRGGLDWESSIPNRTFQVPVETPSVIPVSYFDNDSGATGPPPLAWSAGLSSDTTVALSWQANQIPGHLYYAVYRDVQATQDNPPILIGTTPNTTLTDPDPPAGPVVYWVTSNSFFNSEQITAPTLVDIAAASQYTQSAGWNLVSVPVAAPSMSVSQLFPGLVSQAFAYQGSYQPVDPLSVGPGYWVKRSGAQTVAIGGAGVPAASVAVQPGWNLVGSIGLPVDAASVSSIPPGLVVSQFFLYSPQSGYASADTIHPWRGYWVKAADSGQLVLSSSPSPEGRIKIVPIAELPPAPPGEERAGQEGLVPAAFSLSQNYPNPFNPTTDIRLQITDFGRVRLLVYDLLGRQVATLVDEEKAPGSYTVTFDASTLASGAYVYRLTAGGFTAARRMLVVK